MAGVFDLELFEDARLLGLGEVLELEDVAEVVDGAERAVFTNTPQRVAAFCVLRAAAAAAAAVVVPAASAAAALIVGDENPTDGTTTEEAISSPATEEEEASPAPRLGRFMSMRLKHEKFMERTLTPVLERRLQR